MEEEEGEKKDGMKKPETGVVEIVGDDGVEYDDHKESAMCRLPGHGWWTTSSSCGSIGTCQRPNQRPANANGRHL